MEITAQRKAFLDMIAWSEGTDRPGQQKSKHHGYDVIVGGGLLTNFADHPRRVVNLPNLKIRSSAAGRYQFIQKTWDALKRALQLPDFGPESQDRAAIELLRECKALPLVDAGRFDEAVVAARKIWASLPGAGYGQRENKMSRLRAAFVEAGGHLA